MATVKINCPKCIGTGLTGTAVEVTCPQCTGTGTISVADTSTLATLDTAAAGGSGSHIVVTTPAPVPNVSVKVLNRGK